MVVVMVMVLVIVILDLYIILHPKNANTHAMAILAQAVMVLIFSHAQQAVYTVHAITAHVHAGQVLPVKTAQQKLQSPILTVTSHKYRRIELLVNPTFPKRLLQTKLPMDPPILPRLLQRHNRLYLEHKLIIPNPTKRLSSLP
jgi:hypothetical protein